jgi:hypothetical protein
MSNKEVYDKYKRTVNMSYSELLTWSKTVCSRKASLDRSPIRRNLRLLGKPFSKWTKNDVSDANRTISFVARMRKVRGGRIVCGKYSRRDISLKNWAFDPFK